MRLILTIITILSFNISNCQELSFTKSTLRIDEPTKKNAPKKDTFNIEIKADKIPGNEKISVLIQKSNESTYVDSLSSVITGRIDSLISKNIIKIAVSTDVWGDEDKYILLTANWTYKGELKQIKDTLFIKNTYPFKGITEKDYTDWNDGKRAEVFIGTNFDFINSKVTLSDWYGGARIFLPAITDLRFDKNKSNRYPRFGIAGGVYHAKSLSNFGNPINNPEFTSVYGKITDRSTDSISVRYDTVKNKLGNEINNWGLYIAPLYQWSRFESSDGKFITNIYLGSHIEVIRRNISYTYNFDTVGTTIKKYKSGEQPRAIFELPENYNQTFYDAYFGISMPIQFLWKDILDMKINPCIGFGSRGYSTQILSKVGDTRKESPGFYLVQFDLLARLGGIRLNIGGEVRGYFPNENPIITSYLGTSFSIQKLVDFVSK